MSIDLLQERIRKLKSPLIVDLSVKAEHIPPHLEPEKDFSFAYETFCRELLRGLSEKVAGVRFSFDRFALLGMLDTLSALIQEAAACGYYVLLDGPAMLTPWAAQCVAETLLRADTAYPCNGLVLSPWIGTDSIKPFVNYCQSGKSVFYAVRTANRSAADLQDLMTGSRLAHSAATDIVNRHAQGLMAKCAYSQMGVLTAGTSAAAVQGLRSKYQKLFFLVDGMDYPGGNAKICSAAFDRFGHGAAVCVGASVTCAWKEIGEDGTDYIQQAKESADRMKNKILRYISIL